MKFKSATDLQRFFVEINRFDLLGSDETVVSKDMVESFIKSRRSLVEPLKNFRKQQNTRQQWRKNRYKMMQGIKNFHGSTLGKRFHRNLARFLVSRVSSNNEILDDTCLEFLKALSSLKTHFWIEREYWHSIEEELDLLELEDELLPTVERVEQAIVKGQKIDEEDFALIFSLTGAQEIRDQECSKSERESLFETLKRSGVDNPAMPRAKCSEEARNEDL